MRIVAWNCCDSFDRKFGHLERLRPDVAVVSECRPSCLKFAGLADRSVWIGDEGQKGLAVVTYGRWRIVSEEPQIEERWFLPVRVSDGEQEVQVVGVWVDSRGDCVPPTLRAIQYLSAYIGERPTILAGDFNQSVIWDRGRGPNRRFATVLDALNRLGLASAWHSGRSEAQGLETQGTLFWRWNVSAPYHIDFIFHPPDQTELRGVGLGLPSDYVQTEISDHVPLWADVEVRQPASEAST